MPKLLIYSHDTYGLGNIRRMLAIATDLSSKHADLSILLVSGSPMLHAFRIPPQIDYIKLPCLGRTQTGKYISRHSDVSVDQVIRIRANILKSILVEYQPDLLLVDKKPLGLEGELRLALQALKQCQRQPRLVLLLRDILDSPETTRAIWKKNHYFDAIDSLYDRVLVVGNQAIFDVAKNYGFPPSVTKKIRYCGYLARQRSQRSVAETRKQLGLSIKDRLVLVTAGGGDDGAALLSCYLKGLKTSTPVPDHHSLLLCGSEMSEGQRTQLEADAAHCRHVQLREFTDDIMRYMEVADVVVSMGGYNTVCELLTLKKNAIVVPRITPVQEQRIRAERMASLDLIQTIHPDQLTADRLSEAVNTALTNGNVHQSKLYQIDLNGLDCVEQEIVSLLASPQLATSAPSRQQNSSFVSPGLAGRAASLVKG